MLPAFTFVIIFISIESWDHQSFLAKHPFQMLQTGLAGEAVLSIRYRYSHRDGGTIFPLLFGLVAFYTWATFSRSVLVFTLWFHWDCPHTINMLQAASLHCPALYRKSPAKYPHIRKFPGFLWIIAYRYHQVLSMKYHLRGECVLLFWAVHCIPDSIILAYTFAVEVSAVWQLSTIMSLDHWYFP